MRPVVNTEKKYTQHSLFTIASGAIGNRLMIEAAAAPSGATQVREGAIISAIYIEMWLTSDDAAQGSVVVTLEKTPGAQTVLMAAGDAAALDSYKNKKNIFHTQMGLLATNVQYPMAVVKGWFKIPKSKRRFGFGDRLFLNIFAQTNGLVGCGFATFKEQY